MSEPTPNSTNGKCTACGGKGYVTDHMMDSDSRCPACNGTGQAPPSNGKPPQDSTDELEQRLNVISNTTGHLVPEQREAIRALIAAECHRYAAEVLEGLRDKHFRWDFGALPGINGHAVPLAEVDAAITAQQALKGEKDA